MALSQAQATTTGTGGRTQPFGQALALAAAIVAILAVAILATSWVAGQGAATSKADPLVQSSAIEFRAGEHAVSGSRDPFMQPGAIQFRAGEHAAGALSTAASRAAGERYPTGAPQAPLKPAPVEITRGNLP